MTDAGWRETTGAKGIHELRHHAGTQTLRATGNLKSAQRLLGHASIISTMRYAHAVEADVLAALQATADAQAPSEAPKPLKRRIKAATAMKANRGRSNDS